MRQRARADDLTVCYGKKQMNVSFSCVWPVIENEFRHNIVKVVCGSTRLSPRGSTATLTIINTRTDTCKTDVNLLIRVQLGHVRYINIQAWLPGFRVKIAKFSSFFCPSVLKRDLDTKKTPNIEVWPESLGAMLKYWHVERGLLRASQAVNRPFKDLRAASWVLHFPSDRSMNRARQVGVRSSAKRVSEYMAIRWCARRWKCSWLV